MGQSSLPETDWKHLSRLRDAAVERIFESISRAAQQTLLARESSARDKVWNTKNTIDVGIKDIRDAFDNDWSRSQARMYLRGLIVRSALTDEEIAGFSEEVRGWIARWQQDLKDE